MSVSFSSLIWLVRAWIFCLVRAISRITRTSSKATSTPAPDAGSETTGTRWIYGSGPVGYQIGPPRTNAVALEGFDSARNVFTARKIAQALVAFDPATVVAAEVELPDSLAS